MGLYTLKKAALSPRTAYRRRKMGELDPITRKIYEQNYYRTPVHRFTGATVANPDILVEADLDAGSTVLDVGAFTGQWSRKVSDRYGATIHAFEPAPAAYRQLRTLADEHPNVVAHEFGLGRTEETATLALAGPGSSTHQSTGPQGEAEVQIRDVTTVLGELGLEQVDLLKVNIEGGEYDLFDRLAETGWLPRMRLVMIQFHEWHPNAYWRRWRVRRALARTHREVWNYSWVWELWEREPAPTDG